MTISPLEAVQTRVLTEVINDRNDLLFPLRQLLMPASREVIEASEFLQIDRLTGSNKTAPFIRKDGKSVMTKRRNGKSETIEFPQVGVKRPLKASDELLKRQAGDVIFATTAQRDMLNAAVNRTIMQDMDDMFEEVNATVEYMLISLLHSGTFSYENESTGVKFDIDLNKPAANTFTVPVLWDQQTARMANDIITATKLVTTSNTEGKRGPRPNIGLCGKNAADAVRLRLERGWDEAIKIDSGVESARARLMNDYNEAGLLYLGNFYGVDLWELDQQLQLEDGTFVDTIDPDYVEMFSTQPLAVNDRELKFGMDVTNLEAIQDGTAVGKYYAWSKMVEEADDTGKYHIAGIKSRPFPWWRHANWFVSMKVI